MSLPDACAPNPALRGIKNRPFRRVTLTRGALDRSAALLNFNLLFFDDFMPVFRGYRETEKALSGRFQV